MSHMSQSGRPKYAESLDVGVGDCKFISLDMETNEFSANIERNSLLMASLATGRFSRLLVSMCLISWAFGDIQMTTSVPSSS
jgi:hypothetical protein